MAGFKQIFFGLERFPFKHLLNVVREAVWLFLLGEFYLNQNLVSYTARIYNHFDQMTKAADSGDSRIEKVGGHCGAKEKVGGPT